VEEQRKRGKERKREEGKTKRPSLSFSPLLLSSPSLLSFSPLLLSSPSLSFSGGFIFVFLNYGATFFRFGNRQMRL